MHQLVLHLSSCTSLPVFQAVMQLEVSHWLIADFCCDGRASGFQWCSERFQPTLEGHLVPVTVFCSMSVESGWWWWFGIPMDEPRYWHLEVNSDAWLLDQCHQIWSMPWAWWFLTTPLSHGGSGQIPRAANGSIGLDLFFFQSDY